MSQMVHSSCSKRTVVLSLLIGVQWVLLSLVLFSPPGLVNNARPWALASYTHGDGFPVAAGENPGTRDAHPMSMLQVGEWTTGPHLEQLIPLADHADLWLPSADNAMGNYYTKRTNDGADYRAGTFIYLHLNKAAGTTTKACLNQVSRQQNKRIGRFPLTSATLSIFVVELLQTGQNDDVLFGDYAFGVCGAMQNRKCSYFTIVRDPYERVISSYNYCRKAENAKDQTCWGLEASEVSVKEWAVHQGSYFFKQLLVKPWFCTATGSSHPEFADLSGIPHSGQTTFSTAPCWMKEKIIMEKALTPQELDILVNYCVDHLEEWFSMVGLTSEYDLSLAMLQGVYGLPFSRTCTNYDKRNTYDYAKGIPNLMGDAEVNEALRADVLLYAKAVAIFKKQKAVFSSLGEQKLR